MFSGKLTSYNLMATEDLPADVETPPDLPGISGLVQAHNHGLELKQQADHWRGLVQKADERLRLTMDLACLGTWEWSIPDNRITREGYHEELFGLRPGTFPGTYEAFLACVHPEDRQRVQSEIDRCLTSRDEYRQEYRVLWPD